MKTMLKSILVSATIAISLNSAAQSPKRYEIKLHDFTHLEIDTSIRVDYRAYADSAGLAVFYATPEMASRLYFNDNAGRSKVDIQCCAECHDGMDYPAITIYSTTLNKIVNSGDSLVTVAGVTDRERFDATLIGNGRLSVRDITAAKVDAKLITGSGQLVISGQCTVANLNLAGTGTIQADNLTAVKGKVTITGTGTVGCDYSEEMTVQGIGTGKIYMRREPAKIKNRAIGIKHLLLDGTGK